MTQKLNSSKDISLLRLARLALLLGVAGFGGGFAIVQQFRRIVVQRYQWVTEEAFVEFFAVASALAIEHEIVTAHHWLSEAAFNDAIVLGQITPGPVAIAATFIGYHVAGLGGALVATFGMFAPPMLLSLAAGRSLEAFRSNAVIRGALHGVTPAMVGILVAAVIALCKTSVHGIGSATLAVVATLVLVFARRTAPLTVLLGGGVATSVVAWLR